MKLRMLLPAFMCLAIVTPAEAAQKIQPGMLVRYPGSDGGCTGNFIYDGQGPRAGKTYIGIASHCVNDLPEPLVLDRDRKPFGNVVHVNWPLSTIRDDWALIEVLPERLSDVDPSQRGNPKFPTGVAKLADAQLGDEIRISGWGSFMYLNEEVQTSRAGYLTHWDGVYYNLVGPILWGDSGGALVHVPTGKALGIVSALCTPNNFTLEHVAVGCTAFGPSASQVMDEMAGKGFPVRMRLAGEPPPPVPAAPASSPPAKPASSPEPKETKSKKRSSSRCKTRKQKRSKRCRRARSRRS